MSLAEQLTKGTSYTSSIHHAAVFVAVGFYALEEDESELTLKIAQITPTNEQLLRLADRHPPEPRWFNESDLPW